MSAVDEPGAIRWEAWSHQEIYDAVHSPAAGWARSLPATVDAWRAIEADLVEVRARYQVAIERLAKTNAGTDVAEALERAKSVTRSLAEALRRAGLSRARRARLNELNEQLRRRMPRPEPPVEDRYAFVDHGLSWLTPPPFHRDETNRRNAEELARDLMRAYENAIIREVLTADTHSRGDSAAPKQTGEEKTVPLPGRLAAGGTQADPTDRAAQVDQARSSAAPLGHDEPPAEGGGRISGQLGMVTRNPRPGWMHAELYPDFGPIGHAQFDAETGAAASSDPTDDEQGRTAGGIAPTMRDEDNNPLGRSRLRDDLFGGEIEGFPGVIGE